MPEPLPRSRRRRKGDYRELIHLLNQRYREQWVRAEALEGELARLRGYTLWPLLAGLRRLKRWLRPAPPPLPLTMEAAPWEPGEAPAPARGRVSVIIPFKDRVELLRNCLRGLRASTHADFEVVLVDNGSAEARTRRYLWRRGARPGTVVVNCPGPFNFSRLCNEGARAAGGDYLLFLNNDTEVLTPDWLERLLAVARDPRVGVVGATLLYPDRTVQHAGVFPRADGAWVHADRGLPAERAGGAFAGRPRAVPAVTGACLLTRRAEFQALGGFDERLPVTMGDVDLCCRARARGLAVVVTPHARLLHFECLSRGYSVDGRV